MGIPLTSLHPRDFIPPALRLADADKPEDQKRVLVVRIPNMFERDNFSTALVRAGVVHYTQPQIRDLVKAGVSLLFSREVFEQKVDTLEQSWRATDSVQRCNAERNERMIELLEQHREKLRLNPKTKPFDQAAATKELEQIQPDIQIEEATRVQATAIQQDIVARYAPLQQAFADLAEQDIKRNWLCVETYVVNWRGFEHTPAGNGRGGITRDEAMWLRGKMGQTAFEELAEFIFALHGLDSDEEKNLDSLIDSYSGLTGSTVLETMSETPSGPGTSTDEPTTAIPAVASPKTTARSSGASKRSGTKRAKSALSQTASPSSISR